MLYDLINPFLIFRGLPPEGAQAGLEVYWPILAQGAVVSVSLALLGCFLVVRGTALLGDALSHSVLPGIVIGFLVSSWFGNDSLSSPWILVGAGAMGLGASVLIELVHRQSRVKEDASLGIVFTTLFALGVLMINTLVHGADLDPGCVLYGKLEYFVVRGHVNLASAAILVAIVVGLVVFWRKLVVSSFDPALAVSLGIGAAAVHYAFMAALSVTVVASFESVGAILVVALLVMPGATARLWVDRLPRMLALAVAHALLSTLIGYWLAHPSVLNNSAAGTITVSGFGLFVLSWVFAPKQGVLTRVLHRVRLRRSIESENLIKTVGELLAAGAAGGAGAGGNLVPVTALSNELRVSPAETQKLIRTAERRGLLRAEGGAVALTDQGAARADRLARAHVLWEAYLQNELGLPPDHVHDAAEWIEHHLDEEDLHRLDGKGAGNG
jgi:ABC-type Mn2+/Zn2+ transport system permease subunit